MEESSKHAAFVLLVNLSIWRIASPVVGFYVLGYPGIIIGVAVSYLCHTTVIPYMGLRLFSVRTIQSESDFIPLRRWMIPEPDNRITERGYLKLAEEATKETNAWVKTKSESQGYVSVYDYVNAALIDEQLYKRVSKLEKDKQAASSYLSKSE